MNDSNCIFCKIVSGELPSYKVYEDENYLAFFDLSAFTRGHTLVIPKKHYRFVWDIEDLDSYFKVVQKIALHYHIDLGYKFVDSLIFGRQIPHAHFHILPYNDEDKDWENALDGLEYLYSEDRRLTPEKGELLLKQFKL